MNNEFGNVYADAFQEAADAAGLEIVEEQTIERRRRGAAAGPGRAIADAAPDVIMATPLGAQCPTFLTEMANQRRCAPTGTRRCTSPTPAPAR